MSGSNLKSQKITNYTECAELCDSELDCTGFSITTNNDYCYLKKANTGTPRRTGEQIFLLDLRNLRLNKNFRKYFLLASLRYNRIQLYRKTDK